MYQAGAADYSLSGAAGLAGLMMPTVEGVTGDAEASLDRRRRLVVAERQKRPRLPLTNLDDERAN